MDKLVTEAQTPSPTEVGFTSPAIENLKRELDIKDLEETEGFSKLTLQQQKIIRTSLLITKRAQNPKNTYSQKHGIIHNCHGAIASLEQEHFFQERSDKLPEGFFRARYFGITENSGKQIANQLAEGIEKTGFPCVVHVCFNANVDAPEDDPAFESKLGPDHSFLILGHNKEGKMMIWEKEGFFGLPYKTTTLEKVCEDHRAYNSWGVRSLRKY